MQTLDEHQNSVTELEMNLKSAQILKSPKPIGTDAVIMADHCRVPSNKTESTNCIDIEIFHCMGSISMANCKPSTNITDDPFTFSHISLQFKHNFTNILNCSAFFVIDASSNMYQEMISASDSQIVQTISIKFIDANDTFYRSRNQVLSGNLGYLLHKPLIVTKYVIANESAEMKENDQNELVLGYFHENSTIHYNDEYYLKVPVVRDNGNCYIGNDTYETISFGENTVMKCQLRFGGDASPNDTQLNNLTADTNFTAVCTAFQKRIFHHVLHSLEQKNVNSTAYDDFNVQISQLGNPKNESKLWVQLEAINAHTPNLDQVIGIYDKSDNVNVFTCRNVILNVRYEFYYGNVMLAGIANQAMIKRATLEFGPRLDLQFKLDEELKVPIYVDVMFHDLTATSAAYRFGGLFGSLGLVLIVLFAI